MISHVSQVFFLFNHAWRVLLCSWLFDSSWTSIAMYLCLYNTKSITSLNKVNLVFGPVFQLRYTPLTLCTDLAVCQMVFTYSCFTWLHSKFSSDTPVICPWKYQYCGNLYCHFYFKPLATSIQLLIVFPSPFKKNHQPVVFAAFRFPGM